ncbi:STAS domain-containing protein [Actinokineospora sp. NBRC 105648]|uniref:STAS domain-containing protein n=1 Tax=Actinokineospora sp. NBRC 105648 TaxID=3032206 RepID=UPI00249FFC26|nr:STAS domain-containing protein [Actinokineospora sp. NBRC 105648]GLZ36702.1 hypothetical protein Acsp05_03270 [Actinokineospora sp. NBRC 105648]
MADSDDGTDAGPPRLRLRVTRSAADRTVIALAGRFDAVEALAVRERLARADITGAGHLVFDLADVTFLDSAGLAVLVRTRQDRMRTGGSVSLIRPVSEDSMRVLRLTQFDQIFTMVDGRARGTT